MARILYVSNPFIGLDQYGGMMTQIMRTREALQQLGHDVSLQNPWQAVENQQYDIVHLFCALNETLELALRLRPRASLLIVSPILDHVYSPRLVRYLNVVVARLPRLSFQLLSARTICRLAHACVVRSDVEQRLVQNGLGVAADKIVTIPVGIDAGVAQARPEAFQAAYGGQAFALFVGAIGNPVKNLLRLIRVLGPAGVRLFVVGPIWSTDYAQACFREAALFPNIRILGPLPPALLLSAYAAAQVLVLPSRQEGAGIVALEAGLAGAHIVITRNGGPRYYFRDFARYVDPDNDNALRDAVLAAMRDQKHGRLRDFLLQSYTWERVGRLHDQLYSQELKNVAASPLAQPVSAGGFTA